MTKIVGISFVVGHTILVLAYWLLSSDPAGTAMLAFFGAAMVVTGWVLVPTMRDVGPTAPVDPDWHERRP